MPGDPSYAAPTPDALYVHDDISDEVRGLHGEDSKAFNLTQDLLDLVRHPPQRVVLTVEEQIDRLLAQGDHEPFGLTLGIGRAGERVARQVHERTGWFPATRRVDVAREEDGVGGYALIATGPKSVEDQLQGLEDIESIAVVDDTVFSGLTMRTVLFGLPPVALARTHAFCLRCVGETLAGIRELCPISAGFAAPGRILAEVSFINASGLVKRVGIRRAGKPTLAFFERPSWIQAWFPGQSDEVTVLCRRLNALLEPELPTT